MVITIGDYVSDRLKRFNIALSEIETEAFFIKYDLDKTADFTAEADNSIDLAFYYMIPDLLLMPDRTQGDTSQKFDRDAILSYYKIIAGRLGLPDGLSAGPQNTVIDMSSIW